MATPRQSLGLPGMPRTERRGSRLPVTCSAAYRRVIRPPATPTLVVGSGVGVRGAPPPGLKRSRVRFEDWRSVHLDEARQLCGAAWDSLSSLQRIDIMLGAPPRSGSVISVPQEEFTDEVCDIFLQDDDAANDRAADQVSVAAGLVAVGVGAGKEAAQRPAKRQLRVDGQVQSTRLKARLQRMLSDDHESLRTILGLADRFHDEGDAQLADGLCAGFDRTLERFKELEAPDVPHTPRRPTVEGEAKPARRRTVRLSVAADAVSESSDATTPAESSPASSEPVKWQRSWFTAPPSDVLVHCRKSLLHLADARFGDGANRARGSTQSFLMASSPSKRCSFPRYLR